MWDTDDYEGRWIQGVCGVFLLLFAAGIAYLLDHGFGANYGYATAAELGVVVVALYVAARCFWYAFTGKDNINRDDY